MEFKSEMPERHFFLTELLYCVKVQTGQTSKILLHGGGRTIKLHRLCVGTAYTIGLVRKVPEFEALS